MPVNEETLSKAIADLENGSFTSQRAAALAYGIPRMTLRNRMDGSKPHRVGHENQQRLTPEQEQFLADWIIEQDMQGFPPSHARAREMAVRVLRANRDHQPLGKAWLPKFIKRNPQVASCIGRRIDAARIDGTQPEQIQRFYDLFQRTQARHNILQENTWNMDEHGIALGVCTNSQVLAAAGKKRTYVKSPENREWVSIVETINPMGTTIRPLVIFKGNNPQTSWFTNSIPNWLYATSENGWTSNSHGLNWLLSIFLPETKPINGIHRMLILDGHGSHTDIDFLWNCFINKVHLVFLPAHSSHVLQPLDLGTFSPLKGRYRSEIAKLSYLDDAAPVKKVRFVKCYDRARSEIFVPRTLKSGLVAAGLFPWNPEKGMKSSQLRINPKKSTQSRPLTPPEPKTVTDLISTTPQNPQHIYEVIELLRKDHNLSRNERIALHKAGKAIGMKNVEKAAMEALIFKANSQLEAFQSRKTKKVIVDPNTRFADIEKIKAAQDEAEALAARLEARKPEIEAKKTSEAILQADMESCMYEFQAY